MVNHMDGRLLSWISYRWLICLLLCALGVSAPLASADSAPLVAPQQELKVAVLAFRGSERAEQRWAATMAYLGERIPGYRFRAVPMNLEQLDQAVIDGAVDFAVTNAGQYVRVGSKYGMSWLATLKSRRHPERDLVIGSALIVRADSDYRQLPDLRHARLGAVSPVAFGGFQIYWGEMASQGYRPERFFSTIKFAGFPVEALTFWVRDGLVDAAVVPACLLETLSDEGWIQAAEFRVIGAQPQPGFDCQTSSRLYPNWSFSALKATPPALAAAVARELLLMPPDAVAARQANALGWTAPVSSYSIHQLYERLDIHPWQQPWWLALRAWLLQHWELGLAAALLLVLGFGHHLWAQLLVQRRSRELRAANAELMQQQQQLAHAQRVAILGELSSDLAHELNQPLAAINAFAQGGTVRLQQGSSPVDCADLLDRISTEAQRGGAIIARIRGFARHTPAKREPVALDALIRETLKLLDYELDKLPLDLQLQLPDAPVPLSADPIEIQQLLINLIHNALEAMAERAPKRLALGCAATPDGAVLWVEDCGVGLDDAQLDTLFKPFHSTKPGGLGLGMAICRRIVEAHDGRIQIHSTPGEGTRVTCHLENPTDVAD